MLWMFFGTVLVLAAVLAVWVGRRQRRMSGTESGNDRLGVRDPRDQPWGPPTGL